MASMEGMDQMDKKVGITILGVIWLIGLFYLGWMTVLWTVIGMAIGTIIKQLKENV